MHEIGYYPGCSLEGTARDYRQSIQDVCDVLEIRLRELPDWNCCGATAAHSLDERTAVRLAGRNLVIAEREGLDIVAPCALCFNRLKVAQKRLLNDVERRYGLPFEGAIQVFDLLDYLCRPDIRQEVRDRLVRPLQGLQAVCYYGCMVNRPPKMTDAPAWENPTNMDELLADLGAEVLDWPFKTDCCGASHAVARPDLVFELVRKLYDRAAAQGAHCIVVSCQMCQANLDLYQERIGRLAGTSYELPVFYFTELLGIALGCRRPDRWLRRHLVDPLPLLRSVGLA